MAVFQSTLWFSSHGPGLREITGEVAREVAGSKVTQGMVTIFCQHTSCSLVIMENADRSAARDLAAWLDRLVPEGDPHFTHTLEGRDDMPSHSKMALTRTSETVPVADGRRQLGAWQGIFSGSTAARLTPATSS